MASLALLSVPDNGTESPNLHCLHLALNDWAVRPTAPSEHSAETQLALCISDFSQRISVVLGAAV